MPQLVLFFNSPRSIWFSSDVVSTQVSHPYLISSSHCIVSLTALSDSQFRCTKPSLSSRSWPYTTKLHQEVSQSNEFSYQFISRQFLQDTAYDSEMRKKIPVPRTEPRSLCRLDMRHIANICTKCSTLVRSRGESGRDVKLTHHPHLP